MIVIPSIVVCQGKCIGVDGAGTERNQENDPVSLAKAFREQGAEWLQVIDVEGARVGLPMNLDCVQRIVHETGLHVQFGGGIRSRKTVEIVLMSNVDRAILGTKLVEDALTASRLFAEHGARLIASLDVVGNCIAYKGREATVNRSPLKLARDLELLGAKRLMLTDVDPGREFQGPNLEMLSDLGSKVALPILANGDVRDIQDLENLAALNSARLEAVVVGKALRTGALSYTAARQAVQSVDSGTRQQDNAA